VEYKKLWQLPSTLSFSKNVALIYVIIQVADLKVADL